MKQSTKYHLKVIGALAIAGLIIGESKFIAHQNRRIGELESSLSYVQQKVSVTQLERDNFRRELIKHGNPEGWVINGDGQGSVWYERWNGDAMGSAWQEFLAY